MKGSQNTVLVAILVIVIVALLVVAGGMRKHSAKMEDKLV